MIPALTDSVLICSGNKTARHNTPTKNIRGKRFF